MGYYRAGGAVHEDVKSGEAGFRIGNAIFETYIKPWAEKRRKEREAREMGYYRAGGTDSFGVMMSDQNAPSTSIQNYVTPALQLWRDKHPGEGDYPQARRRMNPLNPHALRRSMRRVQSFAKFAKRTISFTQRVKMKRHKRK